MKIWPTSVLKRAAQIFISNIVGISAVTLFSWAFLFVSYAKNIIPHVSGFTSFMVGLISFLFGLYVTPAILRVFIRYLLLRSSGQTLTKQILYHEIQPDNSVRFIFLNIIIGLPFIAGAFMYRLYATESLYMMGVFGLVILGLIYVYSRIFIAQIVMVDRTATIDQSLKQAVRISKEYPINSLFIALVILVLSSVNITNVQLLLLQKIDFAESMLTQMCLFSGIRAITYVLEYVVATALYIEIKRLNSSESYNRDI